MTSNETSNGTTNAGTPGPRPPWQIRLALPRWILAGHIAKAIVAILIAVLSYGALRARAEETDLAIRTMQRLAAVESFLSSMKDIEDEQQGYLLTAEEPYLARYRAARSAFLSALSTLRELVAEDPAHPRRGEQLESLADHLQEFSERTMDLARRGDLAGARDLLRNNDQGKIYMQSARDLVARIEGDERARIQSTSSARHRLNDLLVAVTWGGLAALLALMLGVAYASGRAFRDREIQDWVKTGHGSFAADLAGDLDGPELADRAIRNLAARLDAKIGAVHARTPDDCFARLGTYAVSDATGERRFRAGEGLAGQAVRERRLLEIRNVPDGYLAVTSSLGGRKPGHLLVMPAQADGEVEAVIELGFFRPVGLAERQLLERAAETLATALRSARYRARQAELLEESRRQAEELTASQAQLEANQHELEEANAQLEEQARTLESQKEGLVVTRRALEQQTERLERTSRYKSEFLANMSHELRTPLNSLLILSRLLADNKKANLSAEQVQYAESITTAGNDLLVLINDILDLSKIEARRVDLQIEPVPIADLLDDVRRRFEPIAGERGLELVVEPASGCPAVLASDRQRLQQVLTNLVSNAVKFTARGRVRVTAAAHGARHVTLSVEDTGIGIAPEHHEIIFEAFRQADGTTNRRFGGTGLGLSISRELITLLGGEIQLRSAPGEGSTFTAIVPIADATAEPSPARPRHPPSLEPPPRARSAAVDDDRDLPADARRTVLVIEDDATFAAILRDLGRELGFRCLVGGDAAEGLRLARASAPAAVILDIGLPDHSGMAVLERLKRDPATRHVPIHVVSVHDYQQVALEMGAVGYTLKPVKREQLVAAFQLLESRLARAMKRILVVEDDGTQRDAIQDLLAAGDVEIVAVGTADAAVAQLRTSTFDCCVLDLGLPGVSGFELLDRMAQDEACSFPPVIVYTARALTPDEELQLRRRSRSIIIKGARSPERLIEEVSLFLHQVEADLPPEHQRMLHAVRDREAIFEGRRILIVEDDARNIFALSRLLEPRGATIDIARNGKEAIERLAHEPRIDLVLMDVMMPEMDGLAAMREIRKRDAHRGLPIIALTSKAMPDDRRECLTAGASDYVAKPVEVEQLLSLLRVWMPR